MIRLKLNSSKSDGIIENGVRVKSYAMTMIL